MGFLGIGIDINNDGTNDLFVGGNTGGNGKGCFQLFGLFVLLFIFCIPLFWYRSDPEWFEFAKNYITNNVTLPKWAFERWMMRLRFFVPLILIIVPVCLGVFIWAFYCLVQLGIFPQELPAEGQPKKEGEYHRSIKSPNQLESAKAGESSNASNSKGIFFTIIDAVTGKYDAEEPSEAIPSQTKPEATLWVMKPNGEVGGPFTRQYLSELKAAGKLPKGLKASESESGPWQNLPSG